LEKNPELFIIAGPNGAGKSQSGNIFVPPSTPIFNGDKIFSELSAKHPGIDPYVFDGVISKTFENAKKDAINSKADFSFETNYSTEAASKISEEFKEAGYKITLVYFGLKNMKTSGERVNDRASKGGHDIPVKDIKRNYNEGIKRVKNDYYKFDNVIFVDTLNQNIRVVASVHKKIRKLISISHTPNWFRKHFEESAKKMNFPQVLLQKIRLKTGAKKKGLKH